MVPMVSLQDEEKLHTGEWHLEHVYTDFLIRDVQNLFSVKGSII